MELLSNKIDKEIEKHSMIILMVLELFKNFENN